SAFSRRGTEHSRKNGGGIPSVPARTSGCGRIGPHRLGTGYAGQCAHDSASRPCRQSPDDPPAGRAAHGICPRSGESYVHRIGRTGRAGRAGRALLFVENRERRLLRNIERTMKLTIPEAELPNAELLGKRRLEKFAAKVQQQLESSDLD
ncbi:hypothetical protein V9P81_26060, partial [Enterobacter hormaechei subsp. hoffmannii]